METLTKLQVWYASQCNEDWEHTYGVKIGNLDNPGWSVEIDLVDTNLYEKPYAEYSYGMGEDADTSGAEWIHCSVKEGKFLGYGGTFKLNEIIDAFLNWADAG